MENLSNKRKYVKPQLISHGSVEEITGWTGTSPGEFFGSPEAAGGGGAKVGFRRNGIGISH
jgi:hypothetical protein